MTSAFSQRLCRKVRQEGYGAKRRFRWVTGADYSTQVEVLFRREHAHRVWNAIQALLWAHELVMSGADLAATEYERGFSDASESCLTRRAR